MLQHQVADNGEQISVNYMALFETILSLGNAYDQWRRIYVSTVYG